MAAIPEELWRRARELPLASLGLAAGILVVFLGIQAGYSARLSVAHLEVAEAVDYAIQNPVVEVPDRLLPAIRAVLPTFESNEMFSFLKEGAGRRAGATHQETFDQLVQVALARLDSHPYRALAVVPAQLSARDFVTHVLVHSSVIQVLLVVVVLLLIGPLLEATWGRAVFAATALAIAAASAGVFSLVHAGVDRPLLGAGPVLAGLAAALATRFPRGHLNALGWLAPMASVELRLPTWLLAVMGCAGVGLGAALAPGAMPGGLDVGYGISALVAGAGLGALAALGLQRSGMEARLGAPPEIETAPRRVRAGRFDYDKVLALRAAGEGDAAFEMLAAEVERSARHRDAVVTFFEMAVERGEVERAVPVMQQLVREEMRRGAAEVAVSHWRSLAESAPGQRLDPALLLRLIPVIRQEDGDEQALIAAQQILDLAGLGLTAPQAAELARLTNALHPDVAVEAARLALGSDALRREHRQEMEELVGRLSEKEDDVPVIAPKELPPNPFFEEQDRSEFAEAGGDLAELADPAYLEKIGLSPEPAPPPPATLARPVGLEPDALLIEVDGRGAARLPLAGIRAIGSVGVNGLGPRPVVITDLVVTNPAMPGAAPRVIRFRSDRFDPRHLAPEAASALGALQGFVAEVAERASAAPLAPAEGNGAGPIAMFESLEAYDAQVLRPLLARISGG